MKTSKKLHRRRPNSLCFSNGTLCNLQLEFATSRAGRQRNARNSSQELVTRVKLRIARQRWIQQSIPRQGGHSSPELETHVKDCKREADRAVQSWETHAKDCKAEADTAAQSCTPFTSVLPLPSFPFVSQLSTAVLQS